MFQNTKTIARKTGLSTSAVNEIVRDLGIQMRYRYDLHHWEIVSPREARALYLTLLENN